jgi:hypothetical protein
MIFASEAREDLKLELAAEALRSGGAVRLRAWGLSMLPSLWPGDVLTIEGSSHFVPVPGDIVLILRNQRPFVHRVEEIRDCSGRRQWITRGDAMPQSDPLAEDSEMLGKVVFIQRNRRVIIPSQRLSTTARLLAWMLCHWDRFRSICLRMHSFRQGLGQQARKEFANV